MSKAPQSRPVKISTKTKPQFVRRKKKTTKEGAAPTALRAVVGDCAADVTWVSTGGKAKCPPNPNYPNGIVVDVRTRPDPQFGCKVDLPYPSPGIGQYHVRCRVCGVSVGCTAAGRADDPHSLVLPCNLMSRA